MYEQLLNALADDIATAGATAKVLTGHEDDPGPSALALRLLGSVHRLVLQGRAGELAAFYPSVGGRWAAEPGTAAFLRLLSDQPDVVREWLDRPPQTNEVGRSSALYGGLLQLSARLPVRLFELGSSGGLNLLADRYSYRDEAGAWFGAPESPVVLDPAWRGRPLESWPVQVVERCGCDRLPVDPSTSEGRLLLTAYVWPDQAARLDRLRGALKEAARGPAPVRRMSAGEFVAGLELAPGTTTVLWHSVMRQYMSADERAEVDAGVAALGSQATAEAPFVLLFLEPLRRTPSSKHEFLVVMEAWPGGAQRILGTSVGHGVPTTWE